MDIRFLLFPLTSLLERSALSAGKSQLPLTLTPGQLLAARVLAQITPGRILLETSGRQLVAATDLALQAGDQLQLKVVESGPQPQLQVIARLPASTPTLVLRSALPKQIPLEQAFENLKAALDQPNLAPPVRAQIEALLNSLPKPSALVQSDKLQAAIEQSGLFAETQAARSAQAIQADLKTRLLELAASIESPRAHSATFVPTPRAGLDDPLESAFRADTSRSQPLLDLAQKVSGALARIVLDQLASLPKPDTQLFAWHLEIPFSEGERFKTLRLTITGEGNPNKRSSVTPRPWTVDLEIAPPGLGRIRAKLVLQGNQISSYFEGETEATVSLIEHHLNALAARLQAAGLEPNCLQVCGKLQALTPEITTAGPLLDEQV